MAVFAGSTLPAPLISTGNKMLVVFKSDEIANAHSFLASYTTKKPVWCSGLVDLTEPLVNVSDGSAQFNYYNSIVCRWCIQPDNTISTILYFTSFNTEEDVDMVKIYDLGTQEL
jgi:hypothetical protein